MSVDGRWRLRPEIAWKRDGDQPGYLFDARTGGVFGLNRTAAALLEALPTASGPADLVALLLDRFEVEAITARRDVDDFLALLEEYDLVGDTA